jgi:hypothetical protein
VRVYRRPDVEVARCREEERGLVKHFGTDGIARPFEPAIILPSQLVHRTSHRRCPELRLAAAVLEDAMLCVGCAVHARSRRLRREFIEARKWFLDDRCDWPFAFKTVCDVLGLDASAVRQRVQHMITAQHFEPPARRYRRLR